MEGKSEYDYRQVISDLVTEAYRNTGVAVEPIFPRVCVKVLPRAGQTATGIWLPQKQNKILIEGVVLAVYKPFWQRHFIADGRGDIVLDRLTFPDRQQVKAVWREAGVQVGDHVIWQHYEGAPVTPLTDEYRLINEDVIQGRLDYRSPEENKKWVIDVLNGASASPEKRGLDSVSRLLSEAHVVRKDMYSLTTSGV